MSVNLSVPDANPPGGGSTGSFNFPALNNVRTPAWAEPVADVVRTRLKQSPGPRNLRICCGISAGLVTLAAILGPAGVFAQEASLVAKVANLYQLLCGLLAVLLEIEHAQTSSIQNRVFEHAQFLARPLGRGIFYICVGLLSISQGSTGYILCGLGAWIGGGLSLHQHWVAPDINSAEGGEGLISNQFTSPNGPPTSMDL